MALRWIIQRRFDQPFKGGRIRSESSAGMNRNGWPACFGIGGRDESESVAGMRRNMQKESLIRNTSIILVCEYL
jgi:hypothetical protein